MPDWIVPALLALNLLLLLWVALRRPADTTGAPIERLERELRAQLDDAPAVRNFLAAIAAPGPIKLIAEVAAPLYAKMGVKTGKDAKNGYATSYGRVLTAILCSLSSRNQTLVAVHEGTDGCVVQAAIPSSMTTWTGKLSMTLERRPEGALVSSAVVFEGQSSDWGRSKRVLDDLHQEILNYRSLQP